MTTALILDILAIALAIVFLIVGIHRGFIKSIVRLLGFAASMIASALISSPVATWLYNTFLHDRMELAVSEKVQQGVADAAQTLNEQIQAITESLPDFLQNLLTVFGDNAQSVSGTAQPNDSLVPTVMDNVVAPVCTALLQIIVFLVLFLILFFVVQLLGKLLDKIFSNIPVIKQLNGLLGGALGLAEGALVVFVLCAALQLYVSLAGDGSMLSMDALEQSRVLKWFMEINPFV